MNDVNDNIIPEIPEAAIEKLCSILIEKNLGDTQELRVVAKKEIIKSILFLEELGAKVVWKNGRKVH